MANIHKTCMTVRLVMRDWATHTRDKMNSRKFLEDQKASVDSAVILKRLLPRDAIARLQNVNSEIRATHYSMSLPWEDRGQRIITARSYEDPYLPTMNDLLRKRERILEEDIFSKWDEIVERGKRDLGKLANDSDYPDIKQVRARFSAEIIPGQVETTEDFRVELSATMAAQVKKDIEARVWERVAESQRAAWDRVIEPLAKLVDNIETHLTKVEEGGKGRFHRSSLQNVVAAAKAMRKLNLTQDPKLDAACKELEERISGISFVGLKDSPVYARKAKQEIQTLKDRLERNAAILTDN